MQTNRSHHTKEIRGKMNFDPNLSTPIAISLGLLAAALWGSWFIALKYLADYPLEAFFITLFATSVIIVWGLGIIMDGRALFQNITDIWKADPSRIYVTFICGILYVAGILFTLRVYRVLGLAIAQPITSAINVVGGTIISAMIGGVPQNLTPLRIGLSIIFLLAAVLLSMRAGRIRNKAQEEGNVETGLSRDPKEIRSAVILLIIASLLVPAYTTGLSYGLQSITQPNGLAVLPFMAVLVSGAFFSAVLICGIPLTIRKQWHVFWSHGFSIHRLGILSGFAHYGGNILHTFATRNLSSVVSWPLGFTSGLWTQMWGLVFGEFENSPPKAYLYLGGGVLCYMLGAMIIANII
jgi:glucose uptake protein GlcU